MLWMALLLPELSLDVFTRSVAGDVSVRNLTGSVSRSGVANGIFFTGIPGNDSTSAQHSPFAVTTGGPRPRIVAANAAARAAGVRRGQLVSATLALAPTITLVERDEARERAALAELATFVLGFTPHASLAAPRAIVADIEPSLRLFNGFHRLTQSMGDGIAARGYRVRMAFAPTPLAAVAFARVGYTGVVRNRQELPALLAPLPLACFAVDPAVRATLEASGITTFGAACALPRTALARRCGPAFVDLIDRAQGHVPDTRAAYEPPPAFSTRLPLPVPVQDMTAMSFVVRRATRDLTDWLLARGLGVVRFELLLAHERYTHRRTGIPATVVPLALGGATRTLSHLEGVLRERLSRVVLPAAVETITLTALETAPLGGRNFGLLPGDETAHAGAPLLDRLRARLGDASVAVVAAHPGHRPEQAMRFAGPGERPPAPGVPPPRPAAKRGAVPPSLSPSPPGDHGSLTPQTRIRPPPGADLAERHACRPAMPRPLWLLDVPAPLPMQPTEWSQRQPPERLESGWWDGDEIQRDYYRVSGAAGEQQWVYRDHCRGLDDGNWFVHGLFA
jgi:protein ImuB